MAKTIRTNQFGGIVAQSSGREILMEAPPQELQTQQARNHRDLLEQIRKGTAVDRGGGRYVDKETGLPV